jgi:type II secretory pathway pseudopilin PulG
MRSGERGFTYLLLLFAVAAMGLTLAGAGQVWQTVAQREREAELLFVGHQFRLAIASYHDNTPGGTKQYPVALDELVEDRRFPTPRRHLRRVYRDPMTAGTDWGLVKVGGRIVAIHSRSPEAALRTVFAPRDAALEGALRYDQWVFGHEATPVPSRAVGAAP